MILYNIILYYHISSEGTVLLCTDNFTEEETKRLINLLGDKFGLKAGSPAFFM